MYWKQRAKVFWLQQGDQNTRFFHRYASARKRGNSFQRLKNKEGEWVDTEDEIQGTITGYFSDLFKSSVVNGKLTDRETVNHISEVKNGGLVAEVTTEEVKQAVFSMFPEKSPGIDELNPAFFQAYWGIVGADVVKFCREYVCTGELPNGINQTLVCLIPKVKVPKDMADLRPISLCNVLVRILSKVLVQRLKSCL